MDVGKPYIHYIAVKVMNNIFPPLNSLYSDRFYYISRISVLTAHRKEVGRL